MVKLNLGCGNTSKEGYINVDRVLNKTVDKIVDLNITPYPWKDNSIEEINIDQVVEHITLPIDVFLFECYRILKPNGVMHLSTPNFYHWKNRLAILFRNSSIDAYHPYHVKMILPDELLQRMYKMGFDTHLVITGRARTLKWFLPDLLISNIIIEARKRP